MSFPGRHLQRCWHLVDAKDQTVGRLASQIAAILRGKHKPTFLPNKDMGDVVIVVNAEKVQFTGKKWKDKLYRWHTGYPGGLKERPAEQMLQRNPKLILEKAVHGMLMHRGPLRHRFIEPRLRIYEGPNHPHTAQLPAIVPPWPEAPARLHGQNHFGLNLYAHPASYQRSVPKPAQARHDQIVELEE
jgi:large subunit ribosomal protein L13